MLWSYAPMQVLDPYKYGKPFDYLIDILVLLALLDRLKTLKDIYEMIKRLAICTCCMFLGCLGL